MKKKKSRTVFPPWDSKRVSEMMPERKKEATMICEECDGLEEVWDGFEFISCPECTGKDD